MDWLEFFRNFAGFFVILLFSLCFHEVAHGWVARLRGDNTAEMMGRLTMNPIVHMDLQGTVILPLITIFLMSKGIHLPFFGWAKPVPVNPRNLKNPRTDLFWIALAGPLSNLFLALLGTLALVFIYHNMVTSAAYSGLKTFSEQFVITNLFLAFFNLIPLHPLDGGKVLARFLPSDINYKLEQNEHVTSLILLILMISGGLYWLAVPVLGAYRFLITMAAGVVG